MTHQSTAYAPLRILPPRPLSVRDRLILDIARRGPDSALHLGGLLLFPGPAPGPEALAGHLAARVAHAPELTFRLVTDGRRCPDWVQVPDFDVRRHVHVLTVPGSVADDPDAALRAVLDQPLDRERPLWGVWLVRGSGAGPGASGEASFALCYRAHHAFQDGLAAAQTMERLFGPEARPGPSGPARVPAPRRPAGAGLAVLKELLPPVRPAARWPALDVRAGAGPAAGADGPVDAADGSADRRTAVTGSADLAPLHAVSRATGASVTQICLAAVTGALRAWHPEAWTSGGAGRSLRATFAISLRDPEDPLRLLGNRGGVATVPLPCGEPAPLRRLGVLREEAGHARLAETGRRHRVLFDKLPYWCGRLGLNRSIDPRYVPLALADVRTRAPLEWAGRSPLGFYAIPVSVPGQPLFAAWTTYGGRLHITFLGNGAVPGFAGLPALWARALTELGLAAAAR